MDRSILIGYAVSIGNFWLFAAPLSFHSCCFMKAFLKMCNISSSTSSSPIGRLKITYCPQGLHAMSQVATIDDQSFRPDPP